MKQPDWHARAVNEERSNSTAVTQKHTHTHTYTHTNSLATITIIIIMIIIDMINARLQNMKTQTIVKDILSDVKVNENK